MAWRQRQISETVVAEQDRRSHSLLPRAFGGTPIFAASHVPTCGEPFRRWRAILPSRP